MQFTKLFAIVFLLLFVTASPARSAVPTPSPVPSVDPYFDAGCEPNTVCNIHYDKVSRVLQFGQPKEKNWGGQDPTGADWSFDQKWTGEVEPEKIYHRGTTVLQKVGHQLFDSFFSDLDPADLQKIRVFNKNPQRFCTTSRLCVFNPQTGENILNQITEETWCTEEQDDWWNKSTMGTQGFASILTAYIMPTFLAKIDPVIDKKSPPPCGAKMEEGRIMELTEVSYKKENYYDAISYVALTVAQPVLVFMKEIEDEVTGKISEIFSTKVTIPAFDIGGSENYPSGVNAPFTFTVTDKDLADFPYPVNPEYKHKLTTVGGWANTYRPNEHDETFMSLPHAVFQDQEWLVAVAGIGTMLGDTLQSMMGRLEYAQVYVNCSILSDGVQNFPDYLALFDCPNRSWVGASKVQAAPLAVDIPIPPSEPESRLIANASVPSASAIAPNFAKHPSGSGIQKAIENAASKGQIPACVLEAVAMIEGGYTGDYTCKPDSCGAVGPFQISVGICNQCKASACPNVLPKNMTPADMCNTDKSASVAVNVLKGKAKYFGLPLTSADPKTKKQAIIIAGDSYNGTTKPLSRLKSTTNQTLSYGEWVYAHCDPAYTTHVDHQFPK